MKTNEFATILANAHAAAAEAVKQWELDHMPQPFNCGFAWVKVDGTEPIARYCRAQIKLAGKGLEGRLQRIAEGNAHREFGNKGYPGGWQWWRPGNSHLQDMDCHEAGCKAFQRVLADAGIRAEVGTRLD